MRLGRKLATGVVVESTEDIVQEQAVAVEPAAARADEVRLELPDEQPVTAS